jgi:methionine-rich copper-binding protein CopC
MQWISGAAVGIAAVGLAACAGNGEGLDANGRPLGSGDPGGGPLVATFDSIQANVFTPICTTCHAGASAPEGLRLDAANSYDLLVGVPSNEVPSLERVAPGDPDHSYIVQKLEGHAAVGGRMPLGGPYLDQPTIDVIRQWITDGAARAATATGGAMKPFALAVASPVDGEHVQASPRQLVLAFSDELDRTRLDAGAVHLERDGTGGAGMEIAVSVHVPDANPRAVVLMPRTALEAGHYHLRIDAAALASVGGTPLATADGASADLRISFGVEVER